MFKNLIIYRIGPGWTAHFGGLQAGLEKSAFVPCGPTQPVSAGWSAPRGVAHGALVESVAGQWLMRLTVEQRVLPAAVVRRATDERAALIERATGRKPGKRQTRDLRDEVTLDLLPQAFTKQASINVWLNPAQRVLAIDAAAAAKADLVVTQLVKSVDGLALTLLQTVRSPVATMSEWLTRGDPPAGFSVDRECELKSADASPASVRYARHPLDIDEVRRHIADGKLPTRLALTWNGRVSLLLTDALQIRRIAFLDGVFESARAGRDDAFDADAALATGELGRLVPDLIAALGGEQGDDVLALAA